MKISSAFPSKFLKADDLPEGRDVSVVIDDCRMERMRDSNEEKPTLYFQGKSQGLILNVTNGNVLADALGNETDGWFGKTIVLYRDRTNYGGKMVDCVRVRVPVDDPETGF
jgi:hypothetical protein